jgi:DNA topoisomerase-2
LNNELEMLKNKVKFIEDILNKDIIIERKKKDEIIAKLGKRGYPKMSTNVDASEDEKSYKYLVDIPLFSLTEERIDELNKQYKNKKEEFNDYNSTTAVELWKREINEFVEFYKKWVVDRKEDEEDDEELGDKPKKKSKKSKTSTSKSKSTKSKKK